jgi:pyruvate/2-oxoglutarate dehydrogenase complex dihydrolipoamide dehydrogenase (E3) component
MSEREARATGRKLLVAHRPMMRVNRAVEKGETDGLMKMIADSDTREILGAAILGTGGDEAIHTFIAAMHGGLTIDQLRWAVPIHTTVAEQIPTLITALEPV